MSSTSIDMPMALITARGGSKGLPRKNVLHFCGEPMIVWSIRAALNANTDLRVVVSTDDEETASIAAQYGAEVPFLRPHALAGDNAAHVDVVLHALEWMESHKGYSPEYICLLQPTSPLRIAHDIDAAFELQCLYDCSAVIGVSESNQHPYHAYRLDSQTGRIDPYMARSRNYVRRQDLPVSYHVNGSIYLNRVSDLRQNKSFIPADSIPYIMPAERSVDVDSMTDYIIAECLAKKHWRTNYD